MSIRRCRIPLLYSKKNAIPGRGSEMYIKKIYDNNVGPIKDALITFPFNSDGTPKPVIIVGENGSGKSTLLSNIVDAFYEIAGAAFSNARQPNENEGYQYYKAISNAQIHFGEPYQVSYIEFADEKENLDSISYIFKSGTIDFEEYRDNGRVTLNDNLRWELSDNYKNVDISKHSAESVFSRDVLCYFSPDRYEKPDWMGDKYYNLSDYEHPSVKIKWANRLDTPIGVKNVTPSTLQWLLDVIVDSRCDITKKENSFNIAHVDIGELLALGIARANVETIMGNILGTEIYFGLNNRSANASRFCIKDKKDDTIVVPTLDALSTGQSALFNLFATIVRYADVKNINNSLRLEDISGVVIIDEIELHLHSNLQRKVLPQLITLFPKVQFVISTHSPLFLLGMDEYLGSDKYEIYQMPDAKMITSESFSEFQKAYAYFEESNFHERKIREAIDNHQRKPLIVTEGATDWKHLKAAYKHLIENPDCGDWLRKIEFDFLEYEPENGNGDAPIRLKMGESHLRTLCKQSSFIPQSRKLIFIADRDVSEAVRELNSPDGNFKEWGNNVFSFCLPIPEHRTETPAICIEHYYTDEEIKTPIDLGDGIVRRLFIGNEFDKAGFSVRKEDDYFCEDKNACGEKSIAIIDGSNHKKVIHPREEINYALPKMQFAEKILSGEEKFAAFDFSKFIPLFEIIRDILAE